MFCSTVIPTIGRPTLARAVNSVLEQSLDGGEFEVIVVNDSGRPLAGATWQESPHVRILHTNRRERCVARNVGAAAARGDYLHFLDDDDWMLPGALRAFHLLAEQTRGAWLHGGFRLVADQMHIAEVGPEEESNCFIDLVASEWIPLQASLINARTFFTVGGFAPLPSLGGGYEDIDLARRIALQHDFAKTTALVANIRIGEAGSTTNYSTMVEQNRISREKTLSYPGAFARMRASVKSHATAKAYWHGRLVYYCLASVRWNMRHRHFFVAASRGAHVLPALTAAVPHCLSAHFWGGLLKPHFNRVRRIVGELGLYPSAGSGE